MSENTRRNDRKIALVTGGAVRVGKAISLGLAEAGYDVVVHYNRSDTAATEVGREVERLGQKAYLTQGDLSDPDAVAGIAETVVTECGRLDLLVNNAAMFQAKPLLEIEAEEWDRVMAVNLRGPFLMVRETASLLRTSGGNVVNIVDLSAIQPWTDYPHHAVSKAGLLHLTRIMAKVLAPEVRVNAIAPGTVLPPNDYPPEALEKERNLAIVGRLENGGLGSPDDVVRTVLFLAGSPFITGEMIAVDGGRRLGS